MSTDHVHNFFNALRDMPTDGLDPARIHIELDRLITETTAKNFVGAVSDAVVRVNGSCAKGIKRQVVLRALYAGVVKLTGYPDDEKPLPNGTYRSLQRDFPAAIALMETQKKISDPALHPEHADDIDYANRAIATLRLRDDSFPRRYRMQS